MGQAVASVWPTCKFIMFHPPDTGYAPSQNVSTDPQYGWPIGNSSRRNLPISIGRTAGATFQCGVLQGLHPTGGMVQGSGEIFVTRTFEEFRRFYNYRKNVLLPNLPGVPSGFRSTYVANLKLLFFVGDFSFATWLFPSINVQMTPQIFIPTLRNAIDNADDDSYVIAYLQEGSVKGLVKTGNYAYLDSIKEALSIY